MKISNTLTLLFFFFLKIKLSCLHLLYYPKKSTAYHFNHSLVNYPHSHFCLLFKILPLNQSSVVISLDCTREAGCWWEEITLSNHCKSMISTSSGTSLLSGGSSFFSWLSFIDCTYFETFLLSNFLANHICIYTLKMVVIPTLQRKF